jgi:transposase
MAESLDDSLCSDTCMSNFRPPDRLTGFLMPPSLEEWLPERHLARFVVEVVDGLDLSAMRKSYRGTGSASYHPAVLLSLLVYGYATGVFSSRKLERAPMIRWLFASSPPTSTPTTTPSPHSLGAS